MTEITRVTADRAVEKLTVRFAQLLTRDDTVVLLAGDPATPDGIAYLTRRPTPYYDGPLRQLERTLCSSGTA